MGLQTGLVAVILWLQAEWGEEKEDKEQKKKKNTRINQESVACSTRGESSGGVGEKIVYSAPHSTGNSSFNKTCGRVNEMLTLLQLLQSLCGATETLYSDPAAQQPL